MNELKNKLKTATSYDILPIFENMMFCVYLFERNDKGDPVDLLFFSGNMYKKVKECINESGVPRNREISLLQSRGFDYNKDD